MTLNNTRANSTHSIQVEKNDKNSLSKIAFGITLVTEAVISTFVGFGAGFLLDLKFKSTKPWLSVILTLFGLIGGFYRMYLLYTKSENE